MLLLLDYLPHLFYEPVMTSKRQKYRVSGPYTKRRWSQPNNFNFHFFFLPLGLLVSITLPCYHNGRFIGVTATDFSMDDLTSDISLFQNQGHGAYAFMTNEPGRTLVHPLLPTPSGAYDDPVYLDIRALEPEAEFNEVFKAISKYGLFVVAI